VRISQNLSPSGNVWDPASSSYRAKELVDAVKEYFKFDQLAKQLYAKLDVSTAQHVD